MLKTRCCCSASPKWYSSVRKGPSQLVDDYLVQCAMRANEIRNTEHILEHRDDEYQESIRLEQLSKGLTCLLNLREHPAANEPTIGLRRAILEQEMPFKTQGCITMVGCCGECTRKCKFRCVQDILNKLYTKAINIYMGYIKYEDAPFENRIAYDTLMSTQINYETILSVYDSVFSYRTGFKCNKVEDREDFDTENYKYNYMPMVDYIITNKGKMRKQTDPNTGRLLIHEWPESGLCPFCLPQVMYYTIKDKKNSWERVEKRVDDSSKFKERRKK